MRSSSPSTSRSPRPSSSGSKRSNRQIQGSLGGADEDPEWTLADSAFGRQVLRDRGAPADLVDELRELRARGSAYTVFLQPHD